MGNIGEKPYKKVELEPLPEPETAPAEPETAPAEAPVPEPVPA